MKQGIDLDGGLVAAIDAHVHLWDASREDDILICSQHPKLKEQADAAGIEHFLEKSPFEKAIVIQSAPHRDHADWLAKKAAHLPWVVGVVSWIDPGAEDALDQAERLVENPLVCGVRLMINRMEAPEVLLSTDSLTVLEYLGSHGLTIELLSRADQLCFVEQLVSALSCQCVLDHGGMPPATAMIDAVWQAHMRTLASHSHLATKLSGLIEAFPVAPSKGGLDLLLDFLMDRFGAEGLMAASNLPVVSLTAKATVWTDLLTDWVERRALPASDRCRLWGGSAVQCYPRVCSALSV